MFDFRQVNFYRCLFREKYVGINDILFLIFTPVEKKRTDRQTEEGRPHRARQCNLIEEVPDESSRFLSNQAPPALTHLFRQIQSSAKMQVSGTKIASVCLQSPNHPRPPCIYRTNTCIMLGWPDAVD